MQAVGVVLVLISVLTVAAPFAVVAMTYQNNLSELVIPPQVAQIVDETFPSGLEFTLPTFVGSSVDSAARAITLTVNFTNPLNYNLTLKEISADVVCREHNITLGHADVGKDMVIPAAQSVEVDIVFAWSQTAEDHFLQNHLDERSIQVNLINATVNVNDIKLKLPEAIEIPFDIPLNDSW